MDKNIILKYLLDGELDRLLSKPNAKLSTLMQTVIEAYETLNASFTKEQLSMVDKYKEALDTYHAEEILHTVTESFIAGMHFAFALKDQA